MPTSAACATESLQQAEIFRYEVQTGLWWSKLCAAPLHCPFRCSTTVEPANAAFYFNFSKNNARIWQISMCSRRRWGGRWLMTWSNWLKKSDTCFSFQGKASHVICQSQTDSAWPNYQSQVPFDHKNFKTSCFTIPDKQFDCLRTRSRLRSTHEALFAARPFRFNCKFYFRRLFKLSVYWRQSASVATEFFFACLVPLQVQVVGTVKSHFKPPSWTKLLLLKYSFRETVFNRTVKLHYRLEWSSSKVSTAWS